MDYNKMSHGVKLSHLPHSVTEAAIRNFLEKATEEIKSIHIHGNKAKVFFDDEEEVYSVLMLDGTDLEGSSITIEKIEGSSKSSSKKSKSRSSSEGKKKGSSKVKAKKHDKVPEIIHDDSLETKASDFKSIPIFERHEEKKVDEDSEKVEEKKKAEEKHRKKQEDEERERQEIKVKEENRKKTEAKESREKPEVKHEAHHESTQKSKIESASELKRILQSISLPSRRSLPSNDSFKFVKDQNTFSLVFLLALIVITFSSLFE